MSTAPDLRKFSIAEDQFGDGMTIVPQDLLARAADEIERLTTFLEAIDQNPRAWIRGEIKADLARIVYSSREDKP